METTGARQWALEEFGGASLGDVRRTDRLVAMATEAAITPSGRVSEVFRKPAARQGAYDFLESGHVLASSVLASVTEACAKRAAEHEFVFLPIDGTSVNLADDARAKDFGSIGSRERGARGLKVIDAIAVTPAGVPLGLATMQWWARGAPACRSRQERSVEQKETQHWLDAIAEVSELLKREAPNTRGWFQVDREGDAQDILEALDSSGQWFTVRSQSDRKLHTTGQLLRPRNRLEKGRRFLRSYLFRRAPLGYRVLEVPDRGGTRRRFARVAIRIAEVVLHLHDKRTSRHRTLALNVVSVREHGRGPMRSSRSGLRRNRAIDWVLLTNHPVASLEDANRVVFGYAQRWRIEDFHRAWKTGICNVEDTQLRARAHVMKWATVLAAVALRAERLKHLARVEPDRPASDEFSKVEIDALVLLKRRYRRRNERVDRAKLDLATATRWLAELGGYTGRSSGGPPGSITIGRGLERLRMAVEILTALPRNSRKR